MAKMKNPVIQKTTKRVLINATFQNLFFSFAIFFELIVEDYQFFSKNNCAFFMTVYYGNYVELNFHLCKEAQNISVKKLQTICLNSFVYRHCHDLQIKKNTKEP